MCRVKKSITTYLQLSATTHSYIRSSRCSMHQHCRPVYLLLHSCTAALQTYTSTTKTMGGTYIHGRIILFWFLEQQTLLYFGVSRNCTSPTPAFTRRRCCRITRSPIAAHGEVLSPIALTRYYYYILSSPAFCHVRAAAAHLNYVHDEPPHPPHCSLS